MDSAARLMVPIVVGLTGLVGALTGPPDEGENHQRLGAMPRERRVALAENLERFDKLEPAEQAEVRRLGAELARQDPVNLARYREVLRRYTLWVDGLTSDQKQKLADAGSDEERFNLAARFRRAEMAKKPYPGPRFAGIRTGDFGMMGPYEAAHLLRVWRELSDAAKADLAKRSGTRLHDEIRDKGRTLSVPFERFPASEEAHYDAVLDKAPDFKAQLGPFANQVAAKKGGDPAKKAETIKRFQHPFAEFLYFEDHPPPPVKPENLARFAASCPSWLMVMLDPLSPDDARHYLTILYRLLYPEPKEFGPPSDPKAKAGSGATPTPSKPGPAPKKSQATPP